MKRGATVLVGLSTATAALAASPVRALEALVAEERAFAARAQEVGARDAFVEYFAPDALVFSPRPQPAFPGLAEGPAWKTVISWRPEAAGISGDGGLGWTTGPADYRPDAEAAPSAWGHYTSVWKRQPDGRLAVVADIGVMHPEPPAPPPDWRPTSRDRKRVRVPTGADASLKSLLATDSVLGLAIVVDPAVALEQAFTEDARWHHSGAQPAVGRPAAAQAVRDTGWLLTWEPQGGGVVDSRDLGWTYGQGAVAAESGDRLFSYLSVWRWQDERWRLVIQVLSLVDQAG